MPTSKFNYGLPTDYQQYVHLSRYARWRDDLGRRETWEETVDRYIDFFQNRFEDRPAMNDFNWTEIREAILNLEAMPSMRCLMTAGEALRRENVAGFNCFGGSERFLTQSGYRTFSETVGTTQTVLGKDGRWVEGEIKSFGRQRLSLVTFRPGKQSKTNERVTVKVTPDHRWLTERGVVTDLRVGDVVPFVPTPEGEFFNDAFVAGFGFGDGTLDSRGRARVRLCGDKAALLNRFILAGGRVSYPASYNGDPLVCFNGTVMSDWKTLPVNIEEPAWLSSWLNGYLAADGHANSAQPGLSTQDKDAADFVIRIAHLAGYIVKGHNVSDVMETNYGTRSGALHRITLRTTGEFKVTAIELLDEPEEVYCAVVGDGAAFVLERGILTGNCSYTAIDRVIAFDEILYILMCGTGVGFSVERQFVSQLPPLPATFVSSDKIIVVEDSKLGWAQALREVIAELWAGRIPGWDTSGVRPAGARLKTFGGRASGPGPLVELFEFVSHLMIHAGGRKLTSVECHDLVCKIADIVVVGGVRRSALISLSNLSDDRMRNAKSGAWWEANGQRRLANNSVAYTEKPEMGSFMTEWHSLYDSKSGERGIFSRVASQKQAAKNGRRDPDYDFGTNPCSEIILRSQQFCNLSEVVARADDDFQALAEKVRLAAILGTFQASLTDFNYLGEGWKHNTVDEALLGVSLTGVMDHPVLGNEKHPDLQALLENLKQVAVETNQIFAKILGIKPATAVTCVKPSGTVSQLVDSGSGMHDRYADFYLRTVRADKKDPLSALMKAAGVYWEDDVAKPESTDVFYFPHKSPKESSKRNDRTALQQLELWLIYQRHWCEHKPSITVYVRENEWMEVGAWVYKHFDEVSGVSFLPHDDSGHTYKQAPYQECDEATYNEWLAKMPKSIDWSLIGMYETEDQTTGTQELACTAGGCEIS